MAEQSKPVGFLRFHPGISPDTIYYPPFAMLEKLALEHWKPGKTLVLIGGNSILNGVGQPASDLWSVHLQEVLGPDYVVVNLAFRGSFAAEGSAIVAESLIKRGYPVLLVANTSPGAGTGRAVGSVYGYYYWQAHAQGLLFDYAARDKDLEDFLRDRPKIPREQLKEERLAGKLEHYLRFQSLWHAVAYNQVFTVWNSVSRDHPWQRRNVWVDAETPPRPLEERFLQNLENEMNIVRSFTERPADGSQDGKWKLNERWRGNINGNISSSFPPALRARTLMVLSQNAPFYRSRLTPSELERDNIVFDACAKVWESVGVSTLVCGADFENIDFVDRTHLTQSGGRKLAELVAEKVKQISKSIK